ncbi:DUF7537 family lipoprotein [Halosimplex sp. J119]
MRASPLATTAVVALLVLAGCAGLPVTGENEPTPDASPSDFPNASAIDHTVFDTHANAMGNANFTLTVENNVTNREPQKLGGNASYFNATLRYHAEPGASQYLSQTTGSMNSSLNSQYSNGSTTHLRLGAGNNSKVLPTRYPTFNESSGQYLWPGLFSNEYTHGAINATYERKGVEMFQGEAVMRYEANGTDTLTGPWAPSENATWNYENFSATLLLDTDGVIRHYQYTFEKPPELRNNVRYSRTYTLSDVGSTAVEKPEWAMNVTTGS